MQLIAQHLAEVIQTLRTNEGKGPGREKRRATRIEIIARILILPVVDGVAMPPFGALMRDISFTGIGLFLPVGLNNTPDFIVELPRKSERLRVLSTVKYSRTLADEIVGVGAEYVRVIEPNDTMLLNEAASERQRKIQASILG